MKKSWFVFPLLVLSFVNANASIFDLGHCVSTITKVGDPIRAPDGSIRRVVSLKGTSIFFCTNPLVPIRAELSEPITSGEDRSLVFRSNIKVNLPASWQLRELTEAQKSQAAVAYALNSNIDAGLMVFSFPRNIITSFNDFAENRSDAQRRVLINGLNSPLEYFSIDGKKAIRFETTGLINNENKNNFTYQTVLIEGDTEIAMIKTWMYSERYYRYRAELSELASKVEGYDRVKNLNAPTSIAQSQIQQIQNTTQQTERSNTSNNSATTTSSQPHSSTAQISTLQNEGTQTTITSKPKFSVSALVIGNGAYSNFGRLPNPKNDAQDIAAKFRSFGIQVDLILDADRDTLVKALNEYAAKATGKDVNILYYAGHGLQVEGINYLIPTNMRADGISSGYVKLNGISLNAVMDYMPSKTRLVFLDACRDNPGSRTLASSRGINSVGLAPVNTTTGTMIAYATKEGEVAADGLGKNSPYTSALLQHLDARLDISIILRRVRETVMKMTSNKQEPWEYGSLIGDQLVLSEMAK
jgi:hypothetical protein